MKKYQRTVINKLPIIILLFFTVFMVTSTWILAEDNVANPLITFSDITSPVYVSTKETEFNYTGKIENCNENICKVVWGTTNYEDLAAQEVLDWVCAESNNFVDIDSSETISYFDVEINNLNVPADGEVTLYFYPVEIREVYIEDDSSKSEEDSSSENEEDSSSENEEDSSSENEEDENSEDIEDDSLEGDAGSFNEPQKQMVVKVYEPATITFIQDTSKPEIISTYPNNNSQYINWGHLDVTVQARDEETGIEKVVLYIKEFNRFEGVSLEQIPEQEYPLDVTDDNNREIVVTGTLELKYYPYEYIIRAVAYDTNGNASDEIYLTKPTQGIWYEKESPGITIQPEDENLYYNDETDTYYAKEDQSFILTVTDDMSGIQNIDIYINNHLIKREYGKDTDFSITDENEMKLVINTNQIRDGQDGINQAYDIKVSVKDNAGNLSCISQKLQIDQSAPTIENIYYNETLCKTSSTNSMDTYYGNYGKEDVTLTIDTKDNANGSGVCAVNYYLKDENGLEVKYGTLEADPEGKCYLEISADFKGFLYVSAEDYLGNQNDFYSPINGLIIEKQESHNKENHISIQLQPTDKKDNQGNPLYAGDTEALIIVADEYAGIQSIEWSVIAPNNADRNKTDSVNVASDGTLDKDTWEVVKTDHNLVTEVKASIPITHNSNNITIKVLITDNAGNTSEQQVKLSIDKTAPNIQITFDGKTSDTTYTDIFNSAKTATITVKERNFSESLMNVLITNSLSKIPKVSSWMEEKDADNPDNNTYTATIIFEEDGDYTFSVSGSDLAGNRAQDSGVTNFTIDQTVPVILVSYSQQAAMNQNFYSADRVVTISIKERNFAPERVNLQSVNLNEEALDSLPALGTWKQAGDTYTTSIVLRNDGTYNFTLDVTDKAGNKAIQYQSDRFIIDKTFPEISISNVEDKSANNGEVAPIIQLSDINLDSRTMVISLVGVNSGMVNLEGWYSISTDKRTITFQDFPYEKTVDDLYEMNVSVTDMAGNTTTESITFSVNRFGSVYVFNKALKETGGKYVQSVSGLALTEVNVDSLVDDTIRLVLTVNGIPTTLSEGLDYSIDVNGDEGLWRNYTYSLEDRLFENDGTYILTVYSVDRAGNMNQNTDETKEAEIEFGVDATNPVIIPINFESGETYNETVYQANISIKDNLVLDYVEVYVDGRNVNVNADGENYTFDIPEANVSRNIRIVAVDAAGNQAEYVLKDIWVTTNFFVRWYNNKPVFVATLATGVGIALAIILLFIRRDKRKIK